jgi:hypothetical protein
LRGARFPVVNTYVLCLEPRMQEQCKMNIEKELRIVVFKEDDKFVAQCLEHDICTQADSIEALQDRMSCLIEVELSHNQDIDEAPEKFHKMWDQAFYRPNGNHRYGLMAA